MIAILVSFAQRGGSFNKNMEVLKDGGSTPTPGQCAYASKLITSTFQPTPLQLASFCFPAAQSLQQKVKNSCLLQTFILGL